jgi:hypothetical protein
MRSVEPIEVPPYLWTINAMAVLQAPWRRQVIRQGAGELRSG